MQQEAQITHNFFFQSSNLIILQDIPIERAQAFDIGKLIYGNKGIDQIGLAVINQLHPAPTRHVSPTLSKKHMVAPRACT